MTKESQNQKMVLNLKFSKTKTKITHISTCQSSMNLMYSIHFIDFDIYCHLMLELSFPRVNSNLYLESRHHFSLTGLPFYV